MSRDKVTRGAVESSRERRCEEAARWFVTLQHGHPSARVLKSWKKWESVSENRDAFDAVERTWQLAGLVSDLPPAAPQERAAECYDGSVSIAQWRAMRTAESSHIYRRLFVLHTLGLAAALAAAVFGLVEWVPEFFGTDSARGRSVAVETGPAEHKEIVFEDGTRIHLGAQTSVTARFTEHARSVVLDRGEALFSVAPDPERPFKVDAGGGIITAVGTAFNVRRQEDDDVVVTVTDGIVEITPSQKPAMGREAERVEQHDQRPAARRLVRGQEATYDAQGKIGSVRVAETNASVAWRDGRLKYLGEPLRHVIEDVNRYSSRELILGDPAVGTLLYSGTVFASDIDDWIAGLEQIYPEIEVVMTNDGRVLIRTRRT